MRLTAFSLTTKVRRGAKLSLRGRRTRAGGIDRVRPTALPSPLGNLNAVRDWGHARDFVRGMWLILQQDEPDDYVLATGEAHTVREFVEAAFREADREIEWRGSGVDEQGVDTRTGQVLVRIDPRYRRPPKLMPIGDPAKARQRLGWRHEVGFWNS